MFVGGGQTIAKIQSSGANLGNSVHWGVNHLDLLGQPIKAGQRRVTHS